MYKNYSSAKVPFDLKLFCIIKFCRSMPTLKVAAVVQLLSEEPWIKMCKLVAAACTHRLH